MELRQTLTGDHVAGNYFAVATPSHGILAQHATGVGHEKAVAAAEMVADAMMWTKIVLTVRNDGGFKVQQARKRLDLKQADLPIRF
ncbi:hypothetical protein LTR03_017227 [Friedmanniomyces endolithicus]|nr:hypothetical protein LTR03_017227 [Friedmanniomyces endolithicus]